jgi:hypothetical protein
MTEGTHQQSGINHPPPASWAAVTLMIVGFLACTIAFCADNLLWLWIVGGVVGAVGIVLAKVSDIMEHVH